MTSNHPFKVCKCLCVRPRGPVAMILDQPVEVQILVPQPNPRSTVGAPKRSDDLLVRLLRYQDPQPRSKPPSLLSGAVAFSTGYQAGGSDFRRRVGGLRSRQCGNFPPHWYDTPSSFPTSPTNIQFFDALSESWRLPRLRTCVPFGLFPLLIWDTLVNSWCLDIIQPVYAICQAELLC